MKSVESYILLAVALRMRRCETTLDGTPEPEHEVMGGEEDEGPAGVPVTGRQEQPVDGTPEPEHEVMGGEEDEGKIEGSRPEKEKTEAKDEGKIEGRGQQKERGGEAKDGEERK